MAPSSRTRIAKPTQQPLRGAFKVTKASTLNSAPIASKHKIEAIEQQLTSVEQLKKLFVDVPTRKRRRDTPSSDTENEFTRERAIKPLKRVSADTTQFVSHIDLQPTKLEQLTPPSTPTKQLKLSFEPANQSEQGAGSKCILDELKALHSTLLRALTLHYAHHGLRTAASLSPLLASMTRLYKVRALSQADVERTLAIWELAAIRHMPSTTTIEHRHGPFKLMTSGIGINESTFVEFCWTDRAQTLNEDDLTERYAYASELVSELLARAAGAWQTLDDVPRVACGKGAQTAARQDKISSIRASILTRPRAQPQPPSPRRNEISFEDLSISSPKKSAAQKKTLSLFDRVKAKQDALVGVATPTSVEVLRRRALARVADVVDVLRLKQATQVALGFRSAVHGSPTKAARGRRVCLGVEQMVREIKDSVFVAVAEDELRECFELLAERDDRWCSVYTAGGIKCVTLQGEGPTSREVKAWADAVLADMK